MKTKVDLDQWKCEDPGCTEPDHEIFVGQACHPSKGLIVFYDKIQGCLVLACNVCKGYLMEIKVGN